MAVKYVSEHDSPEDPGGLIREVLDLGEAFAGPAEDVLLSWSLRLGDGLEAATAARLLLLRYGLEEKPTPPGAGGRLVTLLREAAEGRAPEHAGRRRGGWRGRRS